MNFILNLVSIFGTVKSVLSDGLGLLVEFCEGWICLSQVFAPPRTKSPLDHLEVEADQFLSIFLFLLNKFPPAAVSPTLSSLAQTCVSKIKYFSNLEKRTENDSRLLFIKIPSNGERLVVFIGKEFIARIHAIR